MIDRNSPIKDQLKSAAKNAESIDRTYWAFVFNEAHAHIEELEAQLAEVTAEHKDFENEVRNREQGFARKIGDQEARAEAAEAAIPVAYQMALEESLPLPRPDGASTWKLDPEFVMDVAHAIQREEGWDTSMEVVELAMLAAERRMLEAKTRHALTPPADLVEQATQKAKGEA